MISKIKSRLKIKKTAGIRISIPVFQLISRGNGFRDSQNWKEAAEAYGKALQLEPSLAHIWVQLGHMRKEQGDLTGASCAYAEAVIVGEGDSDALAWLHRLFSHLPPARRRDILSFLKRTIPEGFSDEDSIQSAESTVVFDISDLVSYFGHARLPTGIQRVQIETILGAIRDNGAAVQICCAIEGRERWLRVPNRLFVKLCEMAVVSGDSRSRDWLDTVNALHLTLMFSEPLIFPEGAVLINLGTSWWLRNYFLYVREAKSKSNIKYVPFVHDLIPIMTPEHCIRKLTQDFIEWIIGVFAHADAFLVNSESTKKDLILVAARLGYTLREDQITVVPLGADFRKPGVDDLSRGDLEKWHLAPESYVLFVSTIESRKGHDLALAAWERLYAKYGSRVPRLVCVGNRGWKNEAFFRKIENDDRLKQQVLILHGISDSEMSLLYRNCLFSLYPSRYEGWGLPITESLCYGKAVITSDNSSLPEAGGEFAIYIKTDSVEELEKAVEKMAFDKAARIAAEEKVARGFRPMTWRDIAYRINDAARQIAMRPASTRFDGYAAVPARCGAWYPLIANHDITIWNNMASAEIFRRGLGWSWPDNRGCWTRAPGGDLLMAPPIQAGIRLWLAARAGKHDVNWTVTNLGDMATPPMCLSGIMAPHERRWIPLDVDAWRRNEILTLRVHGARRDGVLDETPDLIAVDGFFLCDQTEEGRMAFLEAASLGCLDQFYAYRMGEIA
ncbi:glycosyltransferase [Gluconacetobacter sacchari]|uniref:glycosyltransferase n=1 Tax=Gluconacetobacter sacchari TaxID=92759 RepID=UPI0039B53B8F